MADPKPIEYELDHGGEKPPETEAEALARIQREDEEKARSLGLVKEKHSSSTGKRWVDGIGGNSANSTASKLIEQEARLAARQREARAAGFKLALLLVVGLVLAAGAVAVGLDYMGTVKLGIFPEPPAPVADSSPAAPALSASVAPPAPAPKSAIKVLGVIGEAQPLENPASELGPPTVRGPEGIAAPAAPARDPAEQKRLERRVESAQRGVETVQGDLGEKQAAINANLKLLYGILPNPRDVVPDRHLWRVPCAMIELEQAQRALKTTDNAGPWLTRVQNAQAQVNNLMKYLAEDRKMEKQMLGRLEKAKRELETAQAALTAP